MRFCQSVTFLLVLIVALIVAPVGAQRVPDKRNALTPAQSTLALSIGLVAYWTLDEPSGARLDSVGSNDFVEIGNVDSAPGVIGDAVSLNWWPSNGSLYAQDAPELQFPDSPWSLTFWWKSNPYDTAVPLAKWTDLWFSVNVDRERVIVNYEGQYLFTGSGPSDAGWHFYALTYDGTTLALSIDSGTPLTTAVGPPISPAPYVFAVNLDGQARGDLDEVGKWDRALDASEIAALYNGGAGQRP